MHAVVERGEIWVKAPSMFVGYYGDKESTSRVFSKDGWYRTGDMGERFADKSIRILGRIKSAFKLRNGVFVYPEVRRPIISHIQREGGDECMIVFFF